ncbi:MAG: glycine--tRNA ligase subunit beta [Anaerolineae bacterium]|nr:glycine--tRNA ligase subunit beta [Anaerolineae bacterium]
MLTFQGIILRLQQYWEQQGALIWQPYSEKVGAGTMNPATILRALGPEPWNVAYVEPSFRPDDGRYGENPYRMQMHTQFQVILKPDPGDPQERYLRSLEALGIRRERHDIRFVEDNWESPALGAWGLGWEVWLDGMEITQFTYFQQAGGVTLDIPAVEITYGLERIAMYLQGVESVWDLAWNDRVSYGEILRDQEIDYCRYEFEYADVDRLNAMYQLFEDEAAKCLGLGLAVPALDYILRCSHTFNLLDSRGVVGVTERATFFKRMRGLTRQAADAYLARREELSFPWRGRPALKAARPAGGTAMHLPLGSEPLPAPTSGDTPFLFEIGVEELPAGHLAIALEQLRVQIPEFLAELRLQHGPVRIWGTPRRLVVYIASLAERQPDRESLVKGPPARIAFKDGAATRAAQGFARSQGLSLDDLRVENIDGGEYVVATRLEVGRPAVDVLAELLPRWIAALHFPKSMRWNETGVAFSRPIRWLVALLGDTVVPFAYAGLESDRITRGPRPAGSPDLALGTATDYEPALKSYGVLVDPELRQEVIRFQAQTVAGTVGGRIPEDPELLVEVTHLVESPTAFLGAFDAAYLALPAEVLTAVMKKHQRYFPVVDASGRLLPYFVGVRNGGQDHLDVVRQGNEGVILGRYADAAFFYSHDRQHVFESFVPALKSLTFQEDLGSMLAKTERLAALAPWLGVKLGLSILDLDVLKRAAFLAKADLATEMVVEMTSLQGIMGRDYALRSGEAPAVADAIFEHYLPRSTGDVLPTTPAGIALALADRLDSLAGLFAVGLAPTGSADPYGLRRIALGIVQILLGRQISFSIREGVQEAARQLPVPWRQEILEQAVAFVAVRLQGVLRDEGLPYDVVEAVLAERADNPYIARQTILDLAGWVKREDWGHILDNYARCVRITRDKPRYSLLSERLVAPEEQALYQGLLSAESGSSDQKTASEVLDAFVPLTPMIERFFAAVLVMDPDSGLREARLALLQRIGALLDGVADLSKLEGF